MLNITSFMIVTFSGWKPLNIEGHTKKKRARYYRERLLDTSRDPPLTRAAMTRRQIAWIMVSDDMNNDIGLYVNFRFG